MQKSNAFPSSGKAVKIVVLSKYFEDESTPDGALRHTVGLSKALEKYDDLEIHIVTLGARTVTKHLGHKTLHMIERRGYPLENMLFSAFPIVNKIRKIDPQLIHCIGTTQPYGLPAYILSKFYKYKVVVSILGFAKVESEFWTKRPWLIYQIRRIWYPYVEKVLLRNHPVIAQSNSVKRTASEFTNHSIFVIPLGIDNEFWDVQRNNPEKDLILCIAAVWERKGLLDLIKAVEILSKEYQLNVIFAGEVKSRRYYYELQNYIKQHGLSGNIEFLGQVDQDTIESLLERATMLVLPSYDEPFGLVVIEAMAAGTPVVATNVGGPGEIITHKVNGLLAEVADPLSLSEKIELIINDEAFALGLVQNGQNYALHYSWDKVAEQTIDIYIDIINNRIG